MTNTLHTLDVEQVSTLLDQGTITLMDVLTPEHYAARHIPGAVHACVYEMNFLEQVAALDLAKNAAIVLYGAGEGSLDSAFAAEKLLREGYADVRVFTEGLAGWLDRGLILEGQDVGTVEPPHPELELERKTYALVAEESVLRWTGRNNNGPHTGILPVNEGGLSFDENGLGGSFVLDMAKLENTDLAGGELQPVLEAHLKSDDFFFTAMFPTARFTVTSMHALEGATATSVNYRVHGELELRGVRKELAFDAHLRPLGDGRLAFMGRVDFDRTEWGVIYGSARFFSHLGYHVVHDDISVDFRLVLA